MPVVIPQYITVHLGTPSSNAGNVTVTFPDYIKNVASSEIYPTWPESALRANIYAQISFALNRVYTEWYRSRGYNFDITSSTSYDQSFRNGRDIFQNVANIVDDIFNSYIRRVGSFEPLFAQYCNGTTVTCRGLSQWGTVDLANRGLSTYQILTYYYGNDIEIVRNVPIENIGESYPGTPLRQGSRGGEVSRIQVKLNRISQNYPSIPRIYTVDGIFGQYTENAVRRFQQIFNLGVDGIVGRQTWYKISYLYVSVKNLAELESEGESLLDIPKDYVRVLRRGDREDAVKILQFFLSFLADYYTSIPFVSIDGIFGAGTENAVRAAQRQFGLTVDGVVGRQTWNTLNNAYLSARATATPVFSDVPIIPYPGRALREGMVGEDVRRLQQYLSYLASFYPSIPRLSTVGVFGNSTTSAVREFQRLFGLTVDGVVGRQTWNRIIREYESVSSGSRRQAGQFPGYTVGEENV